MYSKDPSHQGIKSIHLYSWKTEFAVIHLHHQNGITRKGNEKYLDFLNKKIQQRQKFLNGDVCGCELCSRIYKIFGRVH